MLKTLHVGINICNINQLSIFDGHLKVRKSQRTRAIIIWVDAIQNHIDTRTIYPHIKV